MDFDLAHIALLLKGVKECLVEVSASLLTILGATTALADKLKSLRARAPKK